MTDYPLDLVRLDRIEPEYAEILSLLGEVHKSRSILQRINAFCDERFTSENRLAESKETASILRMIFPREWHKELLRKMTLDIPRIRIRLEPIGPTRSVLPERPEQARWGA